MSNPLLSKSNFTFLGNNYCSNTLKIIQGILLLFLFVGCKNKTSDINKLMIKSIPQEDKAEDVVLIYSEGGKVKGRLFSKEFIRNEVAKPSYIDMKKGLKVEFYNDSAVVTSTVTARYGRYYEQAQNILLRDSIVIVNKKGERLATEELVWNQKLHKIYTEKFVRITTPTQVMYGDGLEANEDFSWYQITNIKGVMQVDKSEVPE
jgi:LPS export ABC transporter protein LptC